MTVERLTAGRADEAIDVLVEAFRSYPVMTWVIGPGHPDYDDRLHRLVTFFVSMRAWRDEPMFVVRDGGRAVGAATMTLPGDRPVPDGVTARREALWAGLGDDARGRYEAYGDAMRRHEPVGRHHHLNMIGVRPSHARRGLARPLIEAVHALADGDPTSSGTSLTTEVAANLGFYQHFGYAVIGHTPIAPGFESWMLFRPGKR